MALLDPRDRLRILLGFADVEQKTLAEVLGMSAAWVTSYLNGKWADLCIEKQQKVNELVGWDNRHPLPWESFVETYLLSIPALEDMEFWTNHHYDLVFDLFQSGGYTLLLGLIDSDIKTARQIIQAGGGDRTRSGGRDEAYALVPASRDNASTINDIVENRQMIHKGKLHRNDAIKRITSVHKYFPKLETLLDDLKEYHEAGVAYVLSAKVGLGDKPNAVASPSATAMIDDFFSAYGHAFHWVEEQAIEIQGKIRHHGQRAPIRSKHIIDFLTTKVAKKWTVKTVWPKEKQQGFEVWGDFDKREIHINREMNSPRIRFALLRYLALHLIREEGKGNIGDGIRNILSEELTGNLGRRWWKEMFDKPLFQYYFANSFARACILPADIFIAQCFKYHFDIDELSKINQCTYETIAHRFVSLYKVWRLRDKIDTRHDISDKDVPPRMYMLKITPGGQIVHDLSSPGLIQVPRINYDSAICSLWSSATALIEAPRMSRGYIKVPAMRRPLETRSEDEQGAVREQMRFDEYLTFSKVVTDTETSFTVDKTKATFFTITLGVLAEDAIKKDDNNKSVILYADGLAPDRPIKVGWKCKHCPHKLCLQRTDFTRLGNNRWPEFDLGNIRINSRCNHV